MITFPSFLIFSITLASFLFCLTNAATFEVTNNCRNPVWAAAVPGGGQQLNQGQTWRFNVNAGTTPGRIWGRTGCNFDASGRGRCQTGDCGGLLQCTAYGQPPNTLAEYALKQFNNLDIIDISLVDGFNIPMEFSPTAGNCRGIKCNADINRQCPNEMKAGGGCKNLCTVFKTDEYCCNSGKCGPTPLSRFFKERCPDAYSYPTDDRTSFFSCPAGTNYRVVFCPDPAFEVQNQCPYTVWAAAIPGGGKTLRQGETWTFQVEPNTILARIWGRTNCTFNDNGVGKCETGDCGGRLECQTYGAAPNTVAEYALNQFNGRDFFDISLVDGFNIPIGFNPTTDNCRGVNCTNDINENCPNELRVPGGCNDPCTVFKTDEYCCNSGKCGPTLYSTIFKDGCPDAYTYPMDESDSTFSCPGGGTNYKVTFCP